jgi:iron-sulfur cluster assembly accessory protein
MILNITDNAIKKAISLRDEANIDLSTPLRIGIKGGGCSGMRHDLFFDEAGVKDDDITLYFGSLTVVVDPMSAMYLEGTTLDHIDNGLMGAGFKFTNEKIKSTCGCGSSFSM